MVGDGGRLEAADQLAEDVGLVLREKHAGGDGWLARLRPLLDDLLAMPSGTAIAEVLLDVDPDERAPEGWLAVATAALEIMARHGARDPQGVIELIQKIAEQFAHRGDPTAAARLVEIAIDLARGIDGEDGTGVQDLYERLAELKRAAGDPIGAEAARLEAARLARLWREGDDAAAAPEFAGKKRGAPPASAKPATEPEVSQFEVLYATHRRPTGRTNPYRCYGGQLNKLTYGVATVGVPKVRLPGTLALPPELAKRRGVESSAFFTLKDVVPFADEASWYAKLRDRVRTHDQPEILVYIHGFWQAFWHGVLRAAQLGVDLDIRGPTVAYSWPSRNAPLAYFGDRKLIDSVVGDVARLIQQLSQPVKTGLGAGTVRPRVYILAHSMGCDVLFRALLQLQASLQAGSGGMPPVAEVVLASPDIDEAYFVGNAERMRAVCGRVSTYCSGADLPLKISGLFQSGRRVGQNAEAILKAGVDSIDTTFVPTGLIGHDDYVSAAIDDVRGILWHDLHPRHRPLLRPAPLADGTYWIFDGERRNDPQTRSVLAKHEAARRRGERLAE